MKTEKGKLIVIEGLDGSGKSTLINFMKKNFSDKKLIFTKSPTLDNNLIRRYLLGEFQSNGMLPEYKFRQHISTLYSAARVAQFLEKDGNGKNLYELMNEGYHIICDRYTISNLFYQGIKLNGDNGDVEDEYENFYIDISYIENTIIGLPTPYCTIICDISVEQAFKNLTNSGKDLDIHENKELLTKVYNNIKRYKEMAKVNGDSVYSIIMEDPSNESGMKTEEQLMSEMKSILNDIL